jgi:hypothetical protein
MLAAQEGRTLVSHNRRTLPERFGKFIESQTSHGVIIVSRKMSISDAAERLHLLWFTSEDEEYENLIYNLP